MFAQPGAGVLPAHQTFVKAGRIARSQQKKGPSQRMESPANEKPAGENHSPAAGEKPVHEQCIDTPFWIDQTEVTQAQFRTSNGVQAQSSGFSGDNRPVEQVTWFEADAYCQRRGGRQLSRRARGDAGAATG